MHYEHKQILANKHETAEPKPQTLNPKPYLKPESAGAFAALCAGGRVVTWGDEGYGGQSDEACSEFWV